VRGEGGETSVSGGRPSPPQKRERVMDKRNLLALVAILAMIVVAVSLSIAASVKQYQYTGTVTEVDAKDKTLSVDKGGEIWQFSTEGMKDVKLKKGDKVTVFYVMIAKKIESK
jgi:hypothetical protein